MRRMRAAILTAPKMPLTVADDVTIDDPRPGEAGGTSSPEGVAGAAGHVVIAGEEGEETVQIDQFAAKMQKARDMSQNDPKVVANIIKDWMGANG